MAMFESHMLKNANNVTITNSSLNIGTSAKQLAYEKLSAAAAHSALHDSPARTENTRCHKSTRVNILDNLERWAQGILEEEASLVWLYGGAGAGKSAIMQTLSERCAAQKLVLGSFFFSRSDPTRNTATVLIPTLAYQVAQLFPDALQVIHPAINRDTLIFKKSLQVQLMHLLVRPLQHLVQVGTISDTPKSARVFLIDGLDECDNTDHQQEIVQAVAAVCHEHHIPVKFLIASRPELTISTSLRSYNQANRSMCSISLSEDPNAQTDIKRFIEDEFVKICLDHPFRESIPSGWPHVDNIIALVRKSSSHFIYASTTMKYIWSAKENPVRSLQVLLGLEVSRTGSPFAHLDALYRHIFQSVGHRDKVLQILAHCLYSSLPSYASIICIIHEYSLADFYIFMADMTPLMTISLPENNLSGEEEVKLLHASLGDFLCDPTRSGSLHIAKHLYLASKLGRCIQLLDLYSQNLSTEPKWPFTQISFEPYRNLYSQIHETIRLSVNLDAVQVVLSRIGLRYLHNCAQLLSKIEGRNDLYSDCISKIMLVICESQISIGLSKRYMEEFLDILESALESSSMPLGPIILPLIFLGYPTHDLNAIFSCHFTIRNMLREDSELSFDHKGGPTLFKRVVKCIAISDLSIRHRRATLSPGKLAAAVEAILDYSAPRPFSILTTRNATDLKRPGPLSNALVWLLPKAGFSQEIVIFSEKEAQYHCKEGPRGELHKCLDEYNVRVRNEVRNLGKNDSQSLSSFDSERLSPMQVPSMRARERESELRTPLLRVSNPSDSRNPPQEGDTRTRNGNPGVQERIQASEDTGPLRSASECSSGPSTLGSSLSASGHGAGRALGYELDKPQCVSRGPELDMERLGPRPTRALGGAGVLDFGRNRDSPASKSIDDSGSTGWITSRRRDQSGSGAGSSPFLGQTTRRSVSRYNPGYGTPSSQVGHSGVGAVIGASPPRMSNRSLPGSGSGHAQYGQDRQEISERSTATAATSVPETLGYLAYERGRELEEMRALREQHAIEMEALRSQLEDAQRTVNNVREENGQLRGENGQLSEENGKLREENGRLKDGLDSVIDFMRGIESLRQPRAKPEMEKSRLLDSHTRD